jgi:hypothetical protein
MAKLSEIQIVVLCSGHRRYRQYGPHSPVQELNLGWWSTVESLKRMGLVRCNKARRQWHLTRKGAEVAREFFLATQALKFSKQLKAVTSHLLTHNRR